ncbi:hypothetical protein [Microbispora hainanensis]|uniref:DUF397 domain-containing protein n=1 Tax=Microbispora hainanensis TaxID=568844 RepID=A0ABZ1SPN6_9ACTN|nr:hypothetical protein [Microbispora hainanensis]
MTKNDQRTPLVVVPRTRWSQAVDTAPEARWMGSTCCSAISARGSPKISRTRSVTSVAGVRIMGPACHPEIVLV